jgi:hypothetical protein
MEVLSNFPMWLFNRSGEGTTGHRPMTCFEERCPDARYISKKHVHNIVFIPMKGISAMDFNLNDEKKGELINKGRQCTKEFLKKWTY